MKNLSADNLSKKFSLRSKIFCISFGTFLALAGLEFFLRFLGFGYNLIYKAPVDAGAEYKIYCVGESTTWGIGASDPVSKGYPRQLEEMLNKKYKEMKIQCLFDQTIGQNTSEILAKLPQYIKKYRPQLIIFLVGVNNWWNMDRSNILLFNDNRWVSQQTLKVLIFLDQFRLWKLFKSLAFPSGFSKERWDFFYSQAGRTLEEREEGKWDKSIIFDELARHDIFEMIRICKTNHIKTMMCTYPMAVRGLSRIQEDTAKKFDMPLVDLYGAFQELKDPQAYISAEDHWHPNDAGYAIVAKNIYDSILKNGLIGTRKKKDPQ